MARPLRYQSTIEHCSTLNALAIACETGANAITIDQRGVGRPQDALCNIGAVELVTDRIFADNFDGTPTR
jgi:hypothetical protein